MILSSFFIVLLKLNFAIIFDDSFDTFQLSINQKPLLNLNNSRKMFLEIFENFTTEKVKEGNFSKQTIKTILVYNSEKWFSTSKMNGLFSECVFNNCELTKDTAVLHNAAGIIFHLDYGKFHLTSPPVQKKDRHPDQPWIVMYFESPRNIDANLLFSDMWMFTFNWSMTYHFKADIQVPYGALKRLNKSIEKD